ncbi:MAG: hypothetical protein NTW04_05785, partial [Elusimicrobia bacterium]|nr:hypothetical protein [Elusimicrobiota bacterium]
MRLKFFLSNSKGQLAIPSIFVIPTLFLFAVLLLEITKLSVAKMRYQFAIDSAAFVEMTNYTDFFNRAAYLSGAFPQRLFEEAFACPPRGSTDNLIPRTDNTEPECLFDIMHRIGDFPRSEADITDEQMEWPIKFGQNLGRNKVDLNVKNPALPERLELFTNDEMQYLKMAFDPTVYKRIYPYYHSVYYLLGTIYDAHELAFKQFTETMYFYKASYRLNLCGASGSCEDPEDPGVFPYPFKMNANRLQKMYLVGRKATKDYVLYGLYGTKEDIPMGAPGLFQF